MSERFQSISRSLAATSCAIALGAWPGAARAVDLPSDPDHALPCRPTISCTADIVSPGDLEVEAGFSRAHGASAQLWTFPLLVKQSVTKWLQIQVGSNGYTDESGASSSKYFDNVNVGPKFHLAEQGTFVPSLSLSAQLSIPTFPARGYVRDFDAFFVGYASKDIGPIHADLNVGFDVWHFGDASRAQQYTAFALSTTLPAHFGVIAEGYFFTNALPAAPRDGGVRAALTYSARTWLVIDAGGDWGFFPFTRGYTIFAGVTVIPLVL
ncbi:MAG: hypothetical protein ABSC94_15865 [Polyangiaceae bacterium]